MPSQLQLQLRRVLLAAGAPLIPIGCSDAAPTPRATTLVLPEAALVTAANTSPNKAPACAGGWGEDRREGGCRSGPFTGKYARYLALHTGDAREAQLYAACRGAATCPTELCERVLQYKPISSQMIDERFVAFVECAPACDPSGKPGVHVVYTVAGDCAGRRPEGLLPAQASAAKSETGAYHASMARLEGASVYAFARLARELAAHRAPATLVEAACRALADEARHYWMVGALARRAGADVIAPRVEMDDEVRDLEQIALENAVEGCVGETFGAAMVAWQAQAAPEPMLAGMMRTIAREEAQHAELAIQVDAWSRARLSNAAGRRITERAEERVSALLDEVDRSRVSAELEAIGVPGVDAQVALLSGLREGVWRRASSSARRVRA